MAARRPHEIVYDADARLHLSRIERRYHSLIRRQIGSQLRYEPESETRNRKPLVRAAIGLVWDLRLGSQNRFRVFYRVERPFHRVRILAIGVKVRDRLVIGGQEEFQL